MKGQPSEHQAHSLGTFLRALRERQSAVAHGLVIGSRRRTPGLRREEVAQLCGLSVTWYTWIEQGRDVSVSPTALAKLASGLRLSRAERTYLFELADKRDPDRWNDTVNKLPDAALACVDAINGPAYVLDRGWTAIRWNAAAACLFVGWLDAGGEHNLLRYIFLRPEARSLIHDWEERAHRVVGEFRAATTSYIDDPSLKHDIDELRSKSADFARCWESHGVLAREGGERAFKHPVTGLQRYQQTSFSFAGWPDFRMTLLTPIPAVRKKSSK